MPVFITNLTGFGTGPAELKFVGGLTAINLAGTGTTSVSLTTLTGGLASAPIKGDLVIVVYAIGTVEDDIDVEITSGYTELCDLYKSDDYDTNLGVFWKIMPSSPDASFTAGPTGSAGQAGVVAVHVWRGADQTTPIDVTTVTANGEGGGAPDPPSITPVTHGAVILACGASGNGIDMPFDTPADLENFVTDADDETVADATIGIGSVRWTEGAYDPVAWDLQDDTAAFSWIAATLALRPAT